MQKALYMLAELLLHWVIDPRLRARLLSLLGAKVGRNVRIYEASFINLEKGFCNLTLADDVHIGHACLLDLYDKIELGHGVTLSPGVCILTHSDPGSYHHSPLCEHFPAMSASVHIGDYSWVGANSTLLAGASLGLHTVVGAASLVRGDLAGSAVYAGIPARLIRPLSSPHAALK